MTEHLDNYLSACQLGITIASLALWRVAEPLIWSQISQLARYFHRWIDEATLHTLSVPIVFFLITTLHIVVWEQAPKSFAIRDPLQTTQWIILPLHWFYKILRPFIRFLNTLSLWFLRFFGVHNATEEHSHSEEELRMIVAESEEDGHINASERELIQNVFDFDNRQVSEIMTPSHKIFSLDKEDRDNQTITTIIKEWYSRIPIYENGIDNIIGWILLKDLIAQYIQNKSSDLNKLLRPIQYVPETMKIADCLKLLQQSHIHIAVVISEYGTTIGLVTMEDILEELVGDIHDEWDEMTAIVTNPKEWLFLVDATASMSEVNDHLPILLPEDDNYDTVAGYINMLFGRIPSLNETIIHWWYKIIISKRKKQRVEQIKLILQQMEE